MVRLLFATILIVVLVGQQDAHAKSAIWLERRQLVDWPTSASAAWPEARPASEFNVSPFMSITLHYEAERREILVEANFWPGAFAEGQQTTLSLYRRGDEEISLPASASSHFSVLTDRALTRDEIRKLQDETILVISADGLPHSLGVQLIPSLRTIQSDLQTCARLLDLE